MHPLKSGIFHFTENSEVFHSIIESKICHFAVEGEIDHSADKSESLAWYTLKIFRLTSNQYIGVK